MKIQPADLVRNSLVILCVLGLIGLSLWVLRPFLAASVWATMLVVASWPLFLALEARLGGRRSLAIGVMSLLMLLGLVLPLWLAVDTLIDQADTLSQLFVTLSEQGLPGAPAWLASLPLVGEPLSAFWQELAAEGQQGALGRLMPYVSDAGKWLLAQLGGLGAVLLQLVLIVLISAIFYGAGESAADLVKRLGRRLAGSRGEQAILLATQAIRGVALGVGGTALVQSALGGAALLLAGIPMVSLLASLMLILCLAQIGPLLILLPAAAWLFWQGGVSWAIFLLVISVVVAGLDNFLRPALIRRGADLPLLLIFSGVIGGLLGFGLVGIFIGPVVLAVTYTLFLAWVNDVPGAMPDA